MRFLLDTHTFRDSFDRLIIGQSMVENIPVITADSAFNAYLTQILW